VNNRRGWMGEEGAMATLLYLTPGDQGRPLAPEEFEKAGGQEGYRYELIDGKLEVSPLPDLPHDCIKDWLADKLRDYRRQHPEVINRIASPARVFVPDRPGVTTPEPDVAAYRNFPCDRPVAKMRWQDVSPLLVAEVLSEDTADKDLVRNLELYLQVPSIREYWILDPRASADHPTLTVHRRRGRRWQRPINVPAGGTYTTRLLPGFALVLDPRR
jgi:Uma2 family endonuclease